MLQAQTPTSLFHCQRIVAAVLSLQDGVSVPTLFFMEEVGTQKIMLCNCREGISCFSLSMNKGFETVVIIS